MNRDDAQTWQEQGTRAATEAHQPGRFLDEHISPLFYQRTVDGPTLDHREIISDEQFWREADPILTEMRFKGFRLTDWFPRAPGVYWSPRAESVRTEVWSRPASTEPGLGLIVNPGSKRGLIEEGGIGSIRLRPRKIDGEDCWLATALTGRACHAGVPLAIPAKLIRRAGIKWGDQVSFEGRVRNLQDAGLGDTAAHVHHARPLIVFVDKLEGEVKKHPSEPIVITPVALFDTANGSDHHHRGRASYTFVQCAAGSEAELDEAAEWIVRYATKFAGRVITNFDEQRPVLADAPLSYQRLVTRTYERTVIEHFHGTINATRIDQLTMHSATIGDLHVGHKINVGGSAIINIDSVLSNVTQTIGSAPGLKAGQKKELDDLVNTLRADLDKLKTTHADETKEIADALEKAVGNASKPPEQRKQSVLQLSARGLKEAAELVKDVAPTVLTTAGLIAKFIVEL